MQTTQLFDFVSDKDAVKKISAFIEGADDKELFHIDLRFLSAQIGISFNKLLEIFITGLRRGIFTMEWVYHCPFCGLIANETLSIHAATHDNYCAMCKVDFANKLDDTIEVFFSIHPEIKKIETSFKEKFKAQMLTDIQKNKPLSWRTDTTIYGMDIIQNQVYRDLFNDEVLLPDQSLEVMRSTVLFTDIKGSTQLYTDLGDSKAFALVRAHFRILFDVISKNGGVSVKTIGDAVMGVFSGQSDALKAALEAQKAFYEYNAGNTRKLEIKIGMHSGPVIVVTLNGRLDYFGTTVNTAARIQSRALPNEVVISDVLYSNTNLKKLILTYTNRVKKEAVNLKGLSGLQPLYHINIFNNEK